MDNELEWLLTEDKEHPKSITPSKNSKGYVRIHEAKGGRKMPIAAMEDTHIENYVNMMIKIMEETKRSALYEVNDNIDMFEMELNGTQKMDRETALSRISFIMYNLEPYIMELAIRNRFDYISNISNALETILGRTKNNNKLKGDKDGELLK